VTEKQGTTAISTYVISLTRSIWTEAEAKECKRITSSLDCEEHRVLMQDFKKLKRRVCEVARA
jgi:hypothetical protein